MQDAARCEQFVQAEGPLSTTNSRSIHHRRDLKRLPDQAIARYTL